jgi:hypothetical protein
MSNTIHLRRNYVSLSDAARVARALDTVDPDPGKSRHINRLCADLSVGIAEAVWLGASQASVARRISDLTGASECVVLVAVRRALATVRAPEISNPESPKHEEEMTMAQSHKITPRAARPLFAKLGAADPSPSEVRSLAQLARDLAPAIEARLLEGGMISDIGRYAAMRLRISRAVVNRTLGQAVNAHRARHGRSSVIELVIARGRAQQARQEGVMQHAA